MYNIVVFFNIHKGPNPVARDASRGSLFFLRGIFRQISARYRQKTYDLPHSFYTRPKSKKRKILLKSEKILLKLLEI